MNFLHASLLSRAAVPGTSSGRCCYPGQVLLSADDQELASATVAAGARSVLDCTGDSHPAVRKQDVRGLGHFVTIWEQGAANTLGKGFAERVVSAACAGLRDESSSVQVEAAAAVHRACMTEGRRKWWHRLMDCGCGVQLHSLCDAADPAWLSSQLGSTEPALPASKVGGSRSRRDAVQVASCGRRAASCELFDPAGGYEYSRRVSRISLLGAVGGCFVHRGPFRQAVDGVCQIREHVRRSVQTHDRQHFSSPPELESQSANQNGQSQNFLEEQRAGALPRLESLSLCEVGWALKSHLCLSPRSRGEEVQDLLHLSAVPRTHQSRDRAVHDLCSQRTSQPPR